MVIVIEKEKKNIVIKLKPVTWYDLNKQIPSNRYAVIINRIKTL